MKRLFQNVFPPAQVKRQQCQRACDFSCILNKDNSLFSREIAMSEKTSAREFFKGVIEIQF
jgi:hypothetical protein